MKKIRTPIQPLTKQAARDRRTARAFDGWLATRMRSGAARRRTQRSLGSDRA